MAQIREELILYDKFTNTFTRYIRQAEQASGATDAATTATNQMAKAQRIASGNANSLTNTLRGLVGTLLTLQGLKSVVNMSDQLASTTARLDMMNDGLQTTEELQQMIYASAQRSRGLYTETAAFVAKLGNLAGNAFSSNREIIAFAEQINKQMVLSGTTAQESQAAMLQLSQALSSGVLRGEELNSVLEQAPMIAQTIANYLGVTIGEMRELASEGKITAEVVKNAMFDAAEETNAAFDAMPKTWKQVWNEIQNIATKELQPLFDSINDLANIPGLSSGLSKGFELLGKVAGGVIDLIASGIELIAENWNTLAPILISVAIAIGAVMIASAVAAMISWIAATWPLLLIVAVIALIIYQVNQMGYTFEDIFGAVGSVAGWLYAFLYNIVADIWNIIAAFVEFFANVFDDPVGAVARLFFDLLDAILGVVETVAGAIDALLGTDMAGAVSGFRGDMQKWVDDTFGENKIQVERMEKIDYNNTMDQWSAAGKSFGKGLDEFSLGEGGLFSSLDGIQSTLGGIAGDTSALKKSVSATEEDIKSLVEVATQRYVNNINLTSQTPIIAVHGQNTGNTVADGRRLGNLLADMLYEGAASGSLRSIARVT